MVSAASAGVTMTQYALRWALAQPGVVSALVGVKRDVHNRFLKAGVQMAVDRCVQKVCFVGAVFLGRVGRRIGTPLD